MAAKADRQKEWESGNDEKHGLYVGKVYRI